MPISSSTTTSGLSDALRRLTSTTSISRGLAALSSEKSCGKHLWLSKFNKKQINVFLKTPHVVAGSVMSGTVAIDMTLCNTFDVLNPHTLPLKSLVLELHGIERIAESGPFGLGTHHHPFLKQCVLSLDHEQLLSVYQQGIKRGINKLVVSFSFQLPEDLESSHRNRKAAVHYSLRGVLDVNCCQEEEDKIVEFEEPVRVYANQRAISNALLYLPVHETFCACRSSSSTRHDPPPRCSSSSSSCIKIDLELSRSIWSNCAPIYTCVTIANGSCQKILDITLELLRYQQTFTYDDDEPDRRLAASSSTIVARSSAEKLGLMLPLEPGTKDQAIMVIQPPRGQCSIQNSKLIHISYALRLSIVSANIRKEHVIQVPITLIHSISLDPPPNQEDALRIDTSDAKYDACRQMLVDIFRQTPAIEDDDDDDDDVGELDFAFKGSATRRMTTTTTSIYHNNHISTTSGQQAYQQPRVRHGSVWSPKQFGKRPGCLGNAGLDIRRKLNVATAREAWHGYAAEHYYFPSCNTGGGGGGGTSETSPITPVDERRRMLPLSYFELDGNNASVRSSDGNDRKILALLENQLACDLPPPSIVHTF
ncbi:hypothetical protein O0I10_002861 [Lichtheimia ornata]|uniref:Arrestin C-terminal-like domain-containing protein n=1 Tax=Lichtheimia ornata TaxID=688661 RepID=A0AAD7V915_9FUNG|nr:uncharacterized protein O0I10_002861 [Lichtheimia ornata]KAJ8661593.1 hypothetical protein O0I10_002861 [Lichtheimia ornata]